MNCIKCGSRQVRVIDTRARGARRVYRWTTVELPVGDIRQAVDTVNGLEAFAHGQKHTAK